MAETGAIERICIVGCSGTGKSTLARQLGARLGLPVIHLDQLFWLPGWVGVDRATEIARQQAAAAQPRWIIDGNFGGTMAIRFPRAQAIVWLDLPTHAALWGVLRRVAHLRGRTRADLPEGCPERFDWPFTKWVLEFRDKHRQLVERMLEQHGRHARLIQIRRRKDIALVPELLAAAKGRADRL
ncbi:MAG: hypothetical protein KF696_11780 [Planctomycetes bacterium]|nr:hypothetical protein [Planctomycetota bacterium]MCW8136968.1 hypothetical protein [Planctomycetota bacterium]